MANRVVCQNCGARVDLPDGYSRAKIRCAGCGYYAEVPPEMRSAAAPVEEPTIPDDDSDVFDEVLKEESTPTTRPRRATPATKPKPKPAAPRARPAADPRDSRPIFETDEPESPPLLEGDRDVDEEAFGDDVVPYGVPGTGTKPCPHCQGQLPLAATLCVHCGRDLETGEKVKRRYQPINRTWEEGFPWLLRIQVFAGLQVFNFFAAVLLAATNTNVFFDCAGLFSLVVTNLIQIAMQAFLIGTYDTLSVKRTDRGKSGVTRLRRIGFYKLPAEKLPWKKSSNIGITGTDIGWFARLLCIYFGFEGCMYMLSGVFFSLFMIGLAFVYFAMCVGFYWVVIRPERFEVNLCDVHGSTDEVIFRCVDREQAEDVAKTIAETTGLHFKSVM